MAASEPLLRITGLTVRFGALTALDGLELSVARGEIFVLLGGSGSGKTTLLRSIAGFIRPEAGQIVLDGTDLAPLPPHRRPVNTMFQSYALFPHLTVAGNVGFGLRQRGVRGAELAARVAEMLELVELPQLATRRPHQLSGGQQQRVALARSLAPRPTLLLLDEPLSALDRNLRSEMRQELVRLQHSLGTTFILVTHDQEEALTMATRIGVMQAGKLAQIGSPAEVYEQPTSRFVAEFLGTANILPVTVREARPDGVVLAMNGLDVQVHATRPMPDAAGETLLLAIRPERLRLGAADTPNRLPAVVTERAYSGDSVTHTLRLADGTLVRAMHSLRDGLGAERVEIGDSVVLSWQPDACILLAR